MVNTLADAMNMLKTAERAKKKEVIISPASRLIQRVLRILQAHGYVGEFEKILDGRSNKFKVALLGRINEAKALLRLNYQIHQFESLERELLPAPGLGIIIFTTNQGIIDMEEAENRHIGGRTLCYVF